MPNSWECIAAVQENQEPKNQQRSQFSRKCMYILAVLFCLVLFALQLSVCLWWHDYRRDDFPTLKFGVVMADLARHLLREEPFALSAAPPYGQASQGVADPLQRGGPAPAWC